MPNNITLNGVEVSVEDALAALRETGTVTFTPNAESKLFRIPGHGRVKVSTTSAGLNQRALVHLFDKRSDMDMSPHFARKVAALLVDACDWAEGKQS